MKRSSRLASIATLWAAMSAPCTAADIGPPQRWLEWQNNHAVMGETLKRCGVSPQLATQWDQNLQQLARQLAKTPLPWPEGLWGELSGTYTGTSDKNAPCKTVPLTGDIRFAVWPASRLPLKPGQTRPQHPGPGSGEGFGPAEAVRIYLNERQGTSEVDWLKDGAGPRMSLGQQTGTLLGHPVWGEKWLLVTPANRPPPFVPAPLERVVKAWLAAQNAERDKFAAARKEAEAARDKATAAMYTKLLEANRPRIEKVRQLLDGPPAQRQGPVYIAPGDEFQLQPAPDAEAVWMDNPASFDPQLPRSAVQLIAIDIRNLQLDQPAPAKVDAKSLVRQFVERADWRSLAGEAAK